MTDLKSTLEDLKTEIESKQGRWEATIDQIGAAYEIAYTNHVKNLPVPLANPDAKWALGVVGKVLGGSAAAIFPGMGIVVGVIFAPIARSISDLGDYIGAAPPAKGDVFIPGADETPGVYHKHLRSTMTIICTRLKDYINDILRQVRDKPVGAVPSAKLKEATDKARLSPFWYPSRDWDTWDPGPKAEAFEKAFWANWAARMKGKEFAVLSVDLSGVVDSFKRLKIKPDGEYLEKPNMFSGYKNPTSTMAKWGRDYKPERVFGEPLPPDVQAYLMSEGFKRVGQQLKLAWDLSGAIQAQKAVIAKLSQQVLRGR